MSSTIGVQNIAHTNGTVAATVASDGDITVNGDVTVLGDDLTIGDNTGDSELHLISATDNSGRINFGDSGDADIGVIQYEHDVNSMVFKANASEVLRLTSAGDLQWQNAPSSSSAGILFSTPLHPYMIISGGSDTSFRYRLVFQNGNGMVGLISTNGSSTTYATSSDARLKENVDYTFDATTRLKQLKPARFNFIADADTTVDGFLAHEVQSVVPEAITGTHNEVDDDGNPVMQAIDQSKLVPLLVKTIQELEARITALENG